MAWGKLVDMALSRDEKMDTGIPVISDDRPDYPYGLRICLTETELSKLGLDGNCSIDDTLDLQCMARVTSISKDNDRTRIELTITQMAAENESTEDPAEDAAEQKPMSRGRSIYARK